MFPEPAQRLVDGVCICRVTLEKVNQDPEDLLVHLDLLDLELAIAKYVFTSDRLFSQFIVSTRSCCNS